MRRAPKLAYAFPLIFALGACKGKASPADTAAASATATPTATPSPTATPNDNAMGNCHVTGRAPSTETQEITKSDCDSKGGTFTETKPKKQ